MPRFLIVFEGMLSLRRASSLITTLARYVISMQTPLEHLLGEVPNYTFSLDFGCALATCTPIQ
jgi:hypothetical protein